MVGTASDLVEVPPLVGPSILLFLLCGLPLVTYLTWYFELSLDGVKRTPSLRGVESETIEPFGALNWVGLLALIALCGKDNYNNTGR